MGECHMAHARPAASGLRVARDMEAELYKVDEQADQPARAASGRLWRMSGVYDVEG